MTDCLFCGKQHDYRDCPMFGTTEKYLNTYSPKAEVTSEERPVRSSLPITQFEEIFGKEAEPLLLDVVDGEADEWTPEQQELATEILQGDKNIRKLSGLERDVLDSITQQLTGARKIRQPTQKEVPRKAPYVSTYQEMEDLPTPSDTSDPFSGLDSTSKE